MRRCRCVQPRVVRPPLGPPPAVPPAVPPQPAPFAPRAAALPPRQPLARRGCRSFAGLWGAWRCRPCSPCWWWWCERALRTPVDGLGLRIPARSGLRFACVHSSMSMSMSMSMCGMHHQQFTASLGLAVENRCNKTYNWLNTSAAVWAGAQ